MHLNCKQQNTFCLVLRLNGEDVFIHAPYVLKCHHLLSPSMRTDWHLPVEGEIFRNWKICYDHLIAYEYSWQVYGKCILLFSGEGQYYSYANWKISWFQTNFLSITHKTNYLINSMWTTWAMLWRLAHLLCVAMAGCTTWCPWKKLAMLLMLLVSGGNFHLPVA